MFDVVEFLFSLPRIEPLDLPHERVQGYLDIKQPIYDGGVIKQKKKLKNWKTVLKSQKVKIGLQQLKQQVLNIYFSILVARQTQQVLENSRELLRKKRSILQESYKGGVTDQSDLLKLKAEVLEVAQQIDKLEQRANGLIDVLSILTGRPIDTATVFTIPQKISTNQSQKIQRPQLGLIDMQQKKLEAQSDLLKASQRPKISAFGQGGAGYPNPYNIFDDSFSPFYMAGISVSWDIWDWGNKKRKQQQLKLQSKVFQAEKKSKRRQIKIELQQQQNKINELETTLQKDRELIQTRQRIRELASLQLDKGIISSSKYIEAVNKDQSARLQRKLHQLQLVQAQTQYMNRQGAFFNQSNP